jgi:hypothetical protein
VPNTNATVEGNGGNIVPFDLTSGGFTTARYQQVYAASQFGSVPAGGAYITAVVFRVDVGDGWGSFGPATLPAVQINLSTTATTPDALSSTFANNVGLNDTIVFNGSITISSPAIGVPAGFDIVFPLTTPFFYNPAAGNLLMDVRNTGGGNTASFDAQNTMGDSVSRAYSLNVTNTTATQVDTVGLVTEFIIGPPLQLICTNIVINCGQPVPTNKPTYIDLCCTNVSVTLLNTITNGPPCSPTLLQNWLATDCCGNATNCTRVVTVLPSAPTLLCTNLTVACGDLSFTNPPPFFDLCCSNVQVTLFSSFSGGGLCSQSITQTWRAVDLCCFTTNFCTRIVTVLPSAPTLLCTNLVISCVAPYPTNPPAFIDVCCTNVVVSLVSSNFSGTSCSNVVSQTWRAVDLCCFTTNICTRTITVTGVPPIISVCSNIVVKTCATNVVVTWPTNATSPCSSVTVTSAPPSGSVFPAPSTNTVTIKAWDTCGHTNTCTFTLTVTRPVLGILSVTYLTPDVTLHWSDGILQQSTNVAGPYLDVPLAVPPAYTTPATNQATFYRLRCLSP